MADSFEWTGETMSLIITPIIFKDAKVFIDLYHRHHWSPQGALFSIGLSSGSKLVGVATVGRPTARMLNDGFTAEVTRVCVLDNVPNGCSKLYGACWRAAKAIGYTRLITYTLQSESGVSLKSSGWLKTADVTGREWKFTGQRRNNIHPIVDKYRWEVSLNGR
jgi:hypothetical protein|tara:strand:- start:33 stop:521 length:489 start_codon:yes stop_codon:yes gene_type:complete